MQSPENMVGVAEQKQLESLGMEVALLLFQLVSLMTAPK